MRFWGAWYCAEQYLERMEADYHNLSWSTLLLAWRAEAITLQEVRNLATQRILDASDDLLIPLSDLASLTGVEDQASIEATIRDLARTENVHPYLTEREWRVICVQRLLSALPGIHDETEPELDPYYQQLEIEDTWRLLGNPATMPLPNHLIREYSRDDLPLVVAEHQAWLEQERRMVALAYEMHQSGRDHESAAFLDALMLSEQHAQQRVQLVEAERDIYLMLLGHRSNGEMFQAFQRYNRMALREARKQSKQSD